MQIKLQENAQGKSENSIEKEIEVCTEENTKNKNNKIHKKIILLLVIALSAALLIGVVYIWYMQKDTYYQTHFLPNTYINDIECGHYDVKQVAEILDQRAEAYLLKVQGRDANGEKVEIAKIHGNEIGLKLADAVDAVEEVLVQQEECWIFSGKKKKYSYTIIQEKVFDKQLLQEYVYDLPVFQESNMVAPEDAYISEYSLENERYELVQEIQGNWVEIESAEAYIREAILENAEEVDLVELGCYLQPEKTTEDQVLVECVDTANRWLSAEVQYDWNGFSVIIDSDVIKEWVSISDNIPVLDEDAIAAYVNEKADQYDTYGKPRRFLTTLGKEVTLPSGAFGWKTNREDETEALIALIRGGRVTNREPIYSRKAPAKGLNDIGNSYVEADLTNQHLYLYHNGQIVLETDFVSGDMRVEGNITPQGVFGLTYKTTNAILRGADYETPVTYWMPFHGNFGMHDATWRTEFGGDIYLTDGSHGCLNLPYESAEILYSYLYAGHPVICYY